jgi:membrane associated rhomboid family serine protease
MFFVIPWKLRQTSERGDVPEANLAIIAINILFYVLGWSWAVGRGCPLMAILLYAFSHAGLWHLVMNMWALWVFGNPLNRRLGNAYYALVYLGSAALLGLIARLTLSGALVGASGAVFAVITMALILMPRAVVDVAFLAVFPLSLIIGVFSKPASDWQWLVRSVVYAIPALTALLLIPLMELMLYFWMCGSVSCLYHLLGMLCGLGVVLLPPRITLGRSYYTL